jgi:hypothetical protein
MGGPDVGAVYAVAEGDEVGEAGDTKAAGPVIGGRSCRYSFGSSRTSIEPLRSPSMRVREHNQRARFSSQRARSSPASMGSRNTSRFCSLDAPVGQLECPAQPGDLHPAIAIDGTPRTVNRRSARWQVLKSGLHQFAADLRSLPNVSGPQGSCAERTLRAGLGRPARRGWVLKPSISSGFVRFGDEL